MSPTKTVENISGETGISVRVLLVLVGIMVTSLSSAVGVSIAGVLKVSSLSYEINMLRVDVENVTHSIETKLTNEISKINSELVRRTRDRWTDKDMSILQHENERALTGAGVSVALPDPYTVNGR